MIRSLAECLALILLVQGLKCQAFWGIPGYKIGCPMVVTSGRSIGNNSTKGVVGKEIFNKFTLGIGMFRLTVGKDTIWKDQWKGN
jgi:hypothetical protein